MARASHSHQPVHHPNPPGGTELEGLDMKIIAGRVEEDSAVAALVTPLEAAADRELAAATVTLRWGREQIAVVKRAAALMRVNLGSCGGFAGEIE